MEKKIAPYICPKCGGNDCDCIDYEWDSESLRQQYVCQDCGEVWDEYHELIYRGYACKDVDYDEKGNEMGLNVIEPPSATSVDPRDTAFFIIINHK